MVVLYKAAPLLNSYIVVAPVEGTEVRPSGKAKLETHLRVPHGVPVLLSVVADRDCGESTRTGFVGRLDHQLHKGRVLDLEVQAVVPPSGLFEDLKDSLYHATFASSASAIAACSEVGGCNAARMTADACWMTSRLSAKSEALPS